MSKILSIRNNCELRKYSEFRNHYEIRNHYEHRNFFTNGGPYLLRCTLLIRRLRFRFLSLSLSLLSKFLRHIQRVHEFKTFFLSSKFSVCFSKKQLATQLPAEKNAVCSTGLTCVWHFTMAYIEGRMGLPILSAMGGFEPSASGAPL